LSQPSELCQPLSLLVGPSASKFRFSTRTLCEFRTIRYTVRFPPGEEVGLPWPIANLATSRSAGAEQNNSPRSEHAGVPSERAGPDRIGTESSEAKPKPANTKRPRGRR
jgi:hypothetical protein